MGFRSHFFYLMTLLVSLGLITPALAASPSSEIPEQQQLADIAIIRGIINYTRWPVTPQPLRVCIVDQDVTPEQEVELVQRLARALPPDRPASITLLRAGQDPSSRSVNCHIVYISTLTPAARQHLIRHVAEKPILTIAQGTDACSAGIMFCLLNGEKVRFMVNLDATARSPLRIHPQVLRLSSRQTTAQKQ